jgi:pimeloyl-ACP methyl ester carboxylesterase
VELQSRAISTQIGRPTVWSRQDSIGRFQNAQDVCDLNSSGPAIQVVVGGYGTVIEVLDKRRNRKIKLLANFTKSTIPIYLRQPYTHVIAITVPTGRCLIYCGATSAEPLRLKRLATTKAFADSYDDMNFTPPYLGRITARTLIVQGDRDPLYPVEVSVEMARAIPRSSHWIVPNAGHGPVLGQRWPEFLKTAAAFLREREKT